MGTLTWNSCHSIRTNYLGVHGNVMGKHGTDKLTRGSRCVVHLSWTRQLGVHGKGVLQKFQQQQQQQQQSSG